MKKILHFFLVSGLIAIMTACESMIGTVPDSRMSASESKLVVHGYLAASDTLIKIYVGESIPLFRGDSENRGVVLGDARVVLSRDGQEHVIPFDSSQLAYTIPTLNVGVFSGFTYHLRVEHGERVVDASTTIPGPSPVISSYEVDSSFTSFSDFSGRQDTAVTVRFSWGDFPGEVNYYRVSATANLVMSYADYDDDGNFAEKRGRVTVPLTWDERYGASDLQTDTRHDGGRLHSPLGRVRVGRPLFWTSEGRVYAKDRTEVRVIELMLYHTDEHYYHYHRSLRQHLEVVDNPFAEPVLIYSNIRGGLGVFGSYEVVSANVYPPRGHNPF